MRMVNFCSALGFFCVFFCFGVHASPQVSWQVSGSSFLVQATNTEDRQYSCSIQYTLNYTEWDVPKQAQFNHSFLVYKNWSGWALKNVTTWANLSYAGVTYTCS
ncbi:hypothetical protein [Pseudomonas piscis]